jgi:cyclic beta-1,2-glucan synthetase
MYQAAVEGLLGLRRHGPTFSVNPSVPAMWPAYTIEWNVRGTRYVMTVTNPEHRCRGVGAATLDGVAVDPQAIPLSDDGGTHEVAIVLGEERTARRAAG